MKKRIVVVLMATLLAVSAHAGEVAKTLLNVDLKEEPFLDAKVIKTIPASSSVEVLMRRGAWVQVKQADGGQGWLKMTSIRYGDTVESKSDGGWGALLNVAKSGRSGNTGVTVTTGVRGLSAEELKNAKPDMDAVKKMDGFPNSKSEGQSFANAGRLKTQSVDYLAAATTTTSTSGGSNTFGGGRK